MTDPMINLDDLEDWQKWYLGNLSVATSPHDPESTLQIALTHRDVSCIAFAMLILRRIFREMAPACDSVIDKMHELGTFQEFFRERDAG